MTLVKLKRVLSKSQLDCGFREWRARSYLWRRCFWTSRNQASQDFEVGSGTGLVSNLKILALLSATGAGLWQAHAPLHWTTTTRTSKILTDDSTDIIFRNRRTT